jgi:acetate---CoA ligase (ADP-forming)
VDALIAIYVPALNEASAEVAAALVDATLGLRMPVACVFLNEGGPPPALAEARPPLPAFAFPEDAARALARVADYAAWRRRPASPAAVVDPPPRGDEAAAVVAAALARGEGWLPPEDAAALAGCYGIPLLETRPAATPEAAAVAAAELGLPVALKAQSATLVHKSDAGGVRLDLRDGSAVREAAALIARDVRAAGHELDGYVVQRMAGAGVELLVGVAHDPVFGPLVACAAGGVATELMRDAAVRLVPLSEADVHGMLRELAAFPLLEGYRGAPKADVAAVEDVLRRVGALAEAHPEVAELDLNPLLASPAGAVAVDMRVRLEAAPAPAPGPSLQGDWP